MRHDSSKSSPTSESTHIVESQTETQNAKIPEENLKHKKILTQDELQHIKEQRDLGVTIGPNLLNVKILDKNGVSLYVENVCCQPLR